jgi:hypothetical protein
MPEELIVFSPDNKALCIGTKEECIKYIKKEKLTRDQFKIRPAKSTYHTTSPLKPKGFFKRIFKL